MSKKSPKPMAKGSESYPSWVSWLQKRNDVFESESGLVVKARRPDLMDFVLEGEVPQTLMDLFEKEGVVDEEGNAVLDETNPEVMAAMPDIMSLADRMILSCFLEPKAKEGASDIDAGLIGLDDIPSSVKLEFFSWGGEEADGLKQFRPEQK